MPNNTNAAAENAELVREVERLRTALEHYAWEGNWWKDGYGNFTEWQVHKHGYDIAREALKAK